MVKNAAFDYILVETVGVGQSEVEVAGLADCTVVALVPEAGDEVQTLKAGIMEIADVFVVNKADRDLAEALYRNLRILAHQKAHGEKEIPVVKTVATTGVGVDALATAIEAFLNSISTQKEKKLQLLTEKSWQLIQRLKMKGLTKAGIAKMLEQPIEDKGFNLYAFIKNNF